MRNGLDFNSSHCLGHHTYNKNIGIEILHMTSEMAFYRKKISIFWPVIAFKTSMSRSHPWSGLQAFIFLIQADVQEIQYLCPWRC